MWTNAATTLCAAVAAAACCTASALRDEPIAADSAVPLNGQWTLVGYQGAPAPAPPTPGPVPPSNPSCTWKADTDYGSHSSPNTGHPVGPSLSLSLSLSDALTRALSLTRSYSLTLSFAPSIYYLGGCINERGVLRGMQRHADLRRGRLYRLVVRG